MYYNANGEKVSARARWKEMYNAFKNRQELVKAGLTGHSNLMKMGLLTAGGVLIAKKGLSTRARAGARGGGNYYSGSSGCGTCASPTTRPWVTETCDHAGEAANRPLSGLTGPAPTIAPNNAINPATGIAYEGRTRAHQSPIGSNGNLRSGRNVIGQPAGDECEYSS